VSDRKLDVLRRISLLEDLSDNELRTIAATADMLHLRAGEVVREASSVDHSFYLVLSGAVAVAGDAILVAGGCDGAIGLLGEEPETDELRMLSDGIVLVAGPREFGGMLQKVPRFASVIGRELSQRLREQHRRTTGGSPTATPRGSKRNFAA
jgi:CRP-like cAMP-binding protein